MLSIKEAIALAVAELTSKPLNGNQRRRALRKGRVFIPYGYTLAYPGTQEHKRIMTTIPTEDKPRYGSVFHKGLLNHTGEVNKARAS